MAYATDADLTGRVAEAAAVDVAVRTLALDDAQKRLDDSVIGALTVEAHVYLAAHLIAVRTGALGGDSPPVSSKRAGEIAVSYAVGAPGTAWDLSRTKWGRELQSLMSGVAVFPVAVQ